MTRNELAELAGWAEARLPRLIDDAVAATVDRIPFYRDDQIVPAEELHRSIELNLRFLVTAIGDPLAPLDMAAPEATGRRRAHQRTAPRCWTPSTPTSTTPARRIARPRSCTATRTRSATGCGGCRS